MLDQPTATYPVKLLPSGDELLCPSSQTLLDACIVAGVPTSYNCRSGECGECMASLLSGEVYELPGADPAIFTDQDRKQAKILTCMCFPRSALTLDIPLQADAPAIRPALVNAMVQRVEQLTPTIYGVTVETPWPIEYYAGQAFEWVVPRITPNRTYSAANRPGHDAIDFHVRVYPGGKIGAYVSELTAGQPLQLMGPYGQFRFSANSWRPALCVAGGTGLAPLMAVLDHAVASGDKRPIRLIYGARTQDELYRLDQIQEWSRLLPNFEFTPVLSDEPANSGWRGSRGLVTEVLAENVGDAFGLEAYVCGPPAMIDAAVDVLTRVGALEQDIRTDRFVQAKFFDEGMTIHQPFTVPPPMAIADLAMKDGAVIRLRRYGRTGATRLVLSHGNGLAINAYVPFWLLLADQYDLVVFDMRNHGENPLHTREGHRWENFISDIEEIFHGIRTHFGEAQTVGAFHSLASIAVLQHAVRQRDRWDALCVFEPPMMPPIGHPLHGPQHADMQMMTARAQRRPAIYDSPDELASQLRRRAAFSRWQPACADLLARHTLRRLLDGRWTLCCPPEFEAQVYRNNIDPTLFPRLRDIDVPLHIVASDPDSPDTTPAALTAKALHDMLGIDYTMVPGTTHFLQFEEPQACRDHLIGFLRQHGLNS